MTQQSAISAATSAGITRDRILRPSLFMSRPSWATWSGPEPAPLIGSRLLFVELERDELRSLLTMHEQDGGALRGAGGVHQPRERFGRGRRVAIHFLDDVAGLESGAIRGAAVFDVADDH